MKRYLAIWILLIGFSFVIKANENPFNDGEVVNFDLKYKYGMVMVKAGTAQYKVNSATYSSKQAYKTSLTFKTNSFFDKIFKVRDTLYNYSNLEVNPMFYMRHIHEGSTHYNEETYFKKFGKSRTEANTIRSTENGVRFDTIHVAQNEAFDFLSILAHIRTWDFESMPLEETRNISIFSGRSKIDIIARFKGQSIVEKSEKLKYNTYKVELDISDEVFNESKNAIEAWFSSDKNRIPIKIKSKLKIGAIEIDMSSYKGLKHPLTSEIKITPR